MLTNQQIAAFSAGPIWKRLEEALLIHPGTVEIFHNGVRDNPEILVLRDELSGVIFLPNQSPPESDYRTGDYRRFDDAVFKSSLNRSRDTSRRLNSLSQFFVNLDVVDFGFGRGDFIRQISREVSSVIGVELNVPFRESMAEIGVRTFPTIDEIEPQSVDSVFAFHVLEHLGDPLSFMTSALSVLRPGGHLIVEVPHARDLLLEESEAFRGFSLWSQHLMLHTRFSLQRFLSLAGFVDSEVRGVQRYEFSNALRWLSRGLPGGHTSSASLFETNTGDDWYENLLARLDRNDTLLAVGRKPVT